MAETILKEFINNAAGIKIKLATGLGEDGLPTYHAVTRNTGLHLHPLDPDYSVWEPQVFSPTEENLIEANKIFHKYVNLWNRI